MLAPDCVTTVTMAKRKKPKKRAGNTIVFSISVDKETGRLIRKFADERFRGNVSRVIAELAEQVKRQEAAARFLAKIPGYKPKTDEELDRFEAELEEEWRQREALWDRRLRRRGAL